MTILSQTLFLCWICLIFITKPHSNKTSCNGKIVPFAASHLMHWSKSASHSFSLLTALEQGRLPNIFGCGLPPSPTGGRRPKPKLVHYEPMESPYHRWQLRPKPKFVQSTPLNMQSHLKTTFDQSALFFWLPSYFFLQNIPFYFWLLVNIIFPKKTKSHPLSCSWQLKKYHNIYYSDKKTFSIRIKKPFTTFRYWQMGILWLPKLAS